VFGKMMSRQEGFRKTCSGETVHGKAMVPQDMFWQMLGTGPLRGYTQASNCIGAFCNLKHQT